MLTLSIKGKKYLISKENLNKFQQDNQWLINYYQRGSVPDGYYSTSMLADHFHVTQTEIVRWINQDRFKDVEKYGATSKTLSFFIVPEGSVLEYESHIKNLEENYVTADNAKDILAVSHSTIGNWLKNGKLSGSIYWMHAWYILLQTIEKIANEIAFQEQLVSFNEACKRLHVSKNTIQKLIDLQIIHVTKVNNKPYLNKDELELIPKDLLLKPKKINTQNVISYTGIPDGYLSVEDVSSSLEISKGKSALLMRNGTLGKVSKCVLNGRLVNVIHKEAFDQYTDSIDQHEGYLTTKETAQYLGGILYNTISYYIKQGYFPNATRQIHEDIYFHDV
jgi:hypothetical protein